MLEKFEYDVNVCNLCELNELCRTKYVHSSDCLEHAVCRVSIGLC